MPFCFWKLFLQEARGKCMIKAELNRHKIMNSPQPTEENSTSRKRITPLFVGYIHYPTAEELARVGKILDAEEDRYERLEREAEAREAQIKPRVVPLSELLWLAEAISKAPASVPRQ